MSKARASKGLLLEPKTSAIPDAASRGKWLARAVESFVAPGDALKVIYEVILKRLWPDGHGIPGPQVTEEQVRQAVDEARRMQGKLPYSDTFRRMRELQGEEGFTCIIKEGRRYQLVSLELGQKREPRAKPSNSLWGTIQAATNYRCSHCGQQVPNVKLSPDHRVPRSRGGDNSSGNWQPLCEQCNNLKSSSCQGCSLNCNVCHWAFPEDYKPILVDDQNREQIRRASEKVGKSQSDLANEILRGHFQAIK